LILYLNRGTESSRTNLKKLASIASSFAVALAVGGLGSFHSARSHSLFCPGVIKVDPKLKLAAVLGAESVFELIFDGGEVEVLLGPAWEEAKELEGSVEEDITGTIGPFFA
jgi:hypothetical protein